MKRNRFYLGLFAIGIMAMLASGCSETGQFMEDGIPASVVNALNYGPTYIGGIFQKLSI
ncbi:MAG: hypothetical protein LBS88_00755 [Tannerellaceae bacterium]|jgi:hypothetical protein|nr:hypothetical protein [Tannerellaceae bacterium]